MSEQQQEEENNSSSSNLPVRREPRTVDVKEVLALPSDDAEIEFCYGDHIPSAEGFNRFLEANVTPGDSIKLGKAKVLKLIKTLASTLSSGGLSNLPMVCLGSECHRYKTCGLAQAGIELEIGSPCALEKTEILHHVSKLADDFGDGRSYADQLMIQGVAGCEILKSRVFTKMAEDPDPVKDQVTYDPRGNKITTPIENPVHKVLTAINKNEQTLLKGLSMTQEQRLKVLGAGTKSKGTLANQYRERLAEIRKNNGSSVGEDIIDAETIVVEEDVENTVDSEKPEVQ